MPLRPIQTGDTYLKVPGTSKQTGNGAPKYTWVYLPEGRVAKISALMIAYHLGYNDAAMGKGQKFPTSEEIYDLFVNLMPWFPDHYNLVRSIKIQEQNYVGNYFEFNKMDIENRLRYQFCKPGSHKETKEKRGYGISTEHPSSIHQSKPGKIREVFARCSNIIANRLRIQRGISRKETVLWGRSSK